MRLSDFMNKYGMLSEDELIDRFGDKTIKDILVEPINGKHKPETIWDLEEDDRYWCIDAFAGKPMIMSWADDKVDNLERKSGTCFLTEEEAEKEIKKIEVAALLRKYARGYKWKRGERNYYLSYCEDSIFSGITFIYDYQQKSAEEIYFPTSEAAKKAVEEIGEKRIIRDYFQIKENL